MVFTSYVYLLFLALTCLLYWACSGIESLRLIILLGASIGFYASWGLTALPYLVGVTLFAYFSGIYIESAKEERWQQLRMRGCITVLVLALLYFKFWNLLLSG